MQIRITRLASDERMYSICTKSGTHYVPAHELKKWLLDVGAGNASIVAVLDIEPNETMTVQLAKAA